MKKSKRTISSASSMSKARRAQKYAKRHPSFKKEKSWNHQHRFDRQKEPKDSLSRLEKHEAKTLRTLSIVEQAAPTGTPLKGVIGMRFLKGPMHLTHKQLQAVIADLEQEPIGSALAENDILEEDFSVSFANGVAHIVCVGTRKMEYPLSSALDRVIQDMEKLNDEERLDEEDESDQDIPACLEDLFACADPLSCHNHYYLHGTTIVIFRYQLGENTKLREYVDNVLEAAYQDEPIGTSDDNND